MARYTGPVCRQCRRENMKLFLKGDRCYSDKCSFDRRPYPPGQHGQGRPKASEYSLRLREKQKVRRIYGVLERQFRRCFETADASRGVTGEDLLQILERRLDNVVYRLGFAASRPEARQLVLHNHVLVNDRRMNVPSATLRPGDRVRVREKSKKLGRVQEALAAVQRRGAVSWLELDAENVAGVVKSKPTREDVGLPVREQLVVEFYSR